MTCTNDCLQGRECTCCQQTSSDESMSIGPWQWLTDIFYSAVLVCGSAVLGFLIVYYFVLFVG